MPCQPYQTRDRRGGGEKQIEEIAASLTHDEKQAQFRNWITVQRPFIIIL
jgi:hypothetical protein